MFHLLIFCALHICFAFFKKRLCVFDKKTAISLRSRKNPPIFREKYYFSMRTHPAAASGRTIQKGPSAGRQRSLFLHLPENVLLGLDFILFAQTIALMKSLSLGITPDNPCPTGEVNRVVKGVTLYPYTLK